MELKNRRIELSIGRSFELPNKSWVKFNVGLAGDILDDENIETAFLELTKQVISQVFIQEATVKKVV